MTLVEHMRKFAKQTALLKRLYKKADIMGVEISGMPLGFSFGKAQDQSEQKQKTDTELKDAKLTVPLRWAKVPVGTLRYTALKAYGKLLYPDYTPETQQKLLSLVLIPEEWFSSSGKIKPEFLPKVREKQAYFTDLARKAGIKNPDIFRAWNNINTSYAQRARETGADKVTSSTEYILEDKALREALKETYKAMSDPTSRSHFAALQRKAKMIERRRQLIRAVYNKLPTNDKILWNLNKGGQAVLPALTLAVMGPYGLPITALGLGANQAAKLIVDMTDADGKAVRAALYKGKEAYDNLSPEQKKIWDTLKLKYGTDLDSSDLMASVAMALLDALKNKKENWGALAEAGTYLVGPGAIRLIGKGSTRLTAATLRKIAPKTYEKYLLKTTVPSASIRANPIYSKYLKPNPQLDSWGSRYIPFYRRSVLKHQPKVWNEQTLDIPLFNFGGLTGRQAISRLIDPLNKAFFNFKLPHTGKEWGVTAFDVAKNVGSSYVFTRGTQKGAEKLGLSGPSLKSLDRVIFEQKNKDPRDLLAEAMSPSSSTATTVPEGGTKKDRLIRVGKALLLALPGGSYIVEKFSGNPATTVTLGQLAKARLILGPDADANAVKAKAREIQFDEAVLQYKEDASGEYVKKASDFLINTARGMLGRSPLLFKLFFKALTGKTNALSAQQMAYMEKALLDPETRKKFFAFLYKDLNGLADIILNSADLFKNALGFSGRTKRVMGVLQSALIKDASLRYQTGMEAAQDKFAYTKTCMDIFKRIQSATGIDLGNEGLLRLWTKSILWGLIEKNPLNIHKMLALMAYQAGWNNLGDFLNSPGAFYGTLIGLPLTVMLMSSIFSGGNNNQPQQIPQQPNQWQFPAQYSIADRGLIAQ